jgi:hypothetical protein
VGDTIRIFEFAVTGEAIQDQRQSLIAFHIARALKIFIQHGAD